MADPAAHSSSSQGFLRKHTLMRQPASARAWRTVQPRQIRKPRVSRALTTSTRMYGHLHLAQGAHGTRDITVHLAMCAAEQGSKKPTMHTDDEGCKASCKPPARFLVSACICELDAATHGPRQVSTHLALDPVGRVKYVLGLCTDPLGSHWKLAAATPISCVDGL